jgi:hypothetical protein
MASLSEILDDAHDGEAMTALGSEFELTPEQTHAAVTALLPAISKGLKQSTATVDGLGNLLGMMGRQQDLQDMHDDPDTAFGPEGLAAGKDVLSTIFGSSEVSRAVIDQATKFSGVSSNTLQKMLPVLAGILVSGLMKSASTGKAAAPTPQVPSSGTLGDVLGQIFGRGTQESSSADAGPQSPPLGSQPSPAPTGTGEQAPPEGDILGSILREFEKGIRDGRIKPVIIGGGPVQIPMPNGEQSQTPSGPSTSRMPSGPNAPQMPSGDIFGQILRDVLGGALGSPAGPAGPTGIPQGRQTPSPQMKELSNLTRQLGVMGGAGVAVFGDHFEAGADVDQSHVDNIERVFDRYSSSQRR